MKQVRKFLPIIIVLGLLLSLAGFTSPVFADDGQEEKLSSDRLIVQFQPGTSWSEMIKVHQRVGGKLEATIPEIGIQVVTVPPHQKFFKSWLYRFHSRVRYVEPDHIAQILDVPDDPNFDKQWGMVKVQAPEAWDITQSSADIRIAILDTGIDSTHPDLASKIVSKENFSNSDTVEDRYGHGTHCAGIAAAITDNGVGVAGLGRKSSLMNVKVMGDSGSGYYSSIAEGIIWAANHGANVISMSLGGSSSSSTLEEAINYAWDHGVVVVAAAGNNGNTSPVYPGYHTNCIAIAATDSNDNLASWSNRGDWVDVAAPGVSIYSTFPDGYKYWSGTSMACPHVAGLAGLVFSIANDSNGNGYLNDEVRYRIEATCDDIGIDGIGTGRINAYKAVQELSPIGQISGLVTDASTGQPINGATVTNGLRSTTTDSNGNYTLAYVAQATYTVTASASHYYDASQEVTIVAGETSIADFSLTPKPNQAPILDPIGDKEVDEGQLLQFTIHASDADGDPLTYSASNIPEEASFANQTFSWTPNYEQAGTYQVTFEVKDGWGGEDSEAITITVSESLPGQISGTVTDANTDQPIFGATVTAGTRSASTDSNGSYTITAVPAGIYTLRASADGYISSSKTVTVSPGETTIADFSLALMGSMWAESITFTPYSEGLLVKIKVVNPEPVERAKVNGKVKYNGWDKWSFCGITNSDGETTLRLRGAKEGEYLAIITALTHSQYLWDKSKGVTSASYTYGANTGQISGIVTDPSATAPIEAATVTEGTRSATTDSNGKYTITDVPEGTYTLTASAEGYQNASQTVTVVAGETSTADFSLTPIVNHPPALEPIGDKSVNESALLEFTISASDADGDQLSYSASNLPEGASFASQTFSWTPDYGQAGTYQVTFKVADGKGGEDSETITVAVNGVNRAPVLEPIGDKSVNEGELLEFTISATDPDGDTLSYSASNLPQAASFASQTFSWTPDYGQAGTYEVTFTVSDGELSDSETITITVNAVNRVPVLEPIGNKSVNEGELLEFTISASDTDGDSLTYSASNLPEGATFASQTFSWTPDYGQAGTCQVTFTVSDGELSDSETIAITVNGINRAPILDPVGDKSVDEGDLLEFTISATDPDGDSLTYSASNLPQAASFASQTFSWTPNHGQAGMYEVTFTVSDGDLSDSETITITVNGVNRAPVLEPIDDKSVNEGELLQFTISASDPDGDQLTYSASNLPQAASFASQTFSWTPDYGQAGTYQVTFTVSDGDLSDSETIAITVNAVNRVPVLEPIGNKSVNEGALLEFTISASDPDGDTLTYSASNLPQGASFANQTFSWTPDYGQAGTYRVTFTVSDGELTDSETIAITVNGVNRAPVLQPIGDKTIDEGQLLQFTISATDLDGDQLTYSASNLPEGASFANQTFSWTPDYGQAGTYEVTFAVSDGDLSDSETITITVNGVNKAPVLDPIGDKSVNEGELLEFAISASDPDGDTLTYSASALPDGATFTDQTFSWTPDYGQAGTYQVTFTVSDGDLSDSEAIAITVSTVNRAPVLDPIGNKSVTEGELLEFTISASDPDGDQLTYSGSNLPQGAGFASQTFSWTPDYGQGGNYQVTFTVSDGELTDSETITIQVEALEPSPSDSTPPVNEDKDLKLKLGRRNYSDGTYQVRGSDRVYDTGTGVRKVVVEVDGNIAFQADDVNQPEYKFSFTTDLSPGTHSLIIDAWDAAGNHLHRTAEIQITRRFWMTMLMYWFTS